MDKVGQLICSSSLTAWAFARAVLDRAVYVSLPDRLTAGVTDDSSPLRLSGSRTFTNIL
jgi:hypothetical protein